MSEPQTPGPAAFTEVQRFRQPLLLAVLVLVAAPFWWLAVSHWVFGADVEAPGELAVACVVAGVLVPGILLAVRMVTEVSPAGLRVRFPPVVNRLIPFADIRRAEARSYRPLREYGGWGIRWGRKGSRAYNVSGNRGVEVELTNGRTVMIGSRRADELAAAVHAHMGRGPAT